MKLNECNLWEKILQQLTIGDGAKLTNPNEMF